MANMFDENGNYNKTEWKPGDRITAGKLNKIEESLEAINNNDIERHKEADERLDALEEQKEAVNDRFDELEDLVADNKSEVEVLIYENNVKMDRLEQEMNDGIDEVHNVAETVDDKIAEAHEVAEEMEGLLSETKAFTTNAKAEIGTATENGLTELEDLIKVFDMEEVYKKVDGSLDDMEAMVAEVEGDLEGLHAKDEELSEQLAHIMHVDLRQFPKKIGESDDTERIQRAIDHINNNVNSDFYDTGYGVLNIPPGVYDVKTLVLKSNVHIQGSGMGVTRINPIGNSGYVFNTIGTTATVKMSQCEIKDLSISPTCRAGADATKASVGGINFEFVERCVVENVRINNINGIGIKNLENYDSFFQNIELMFVGNDENPALLLDGTTNDSTNAIHIVGVRIEQCPVLLKLTSGTRSNQFIGCKLEGGRIIIEQCNSNVFEGCDFVSISTDKAMIKIGTTVNDIRGLKFNGCSFLAGNREAIGIEGDASAISITLTNCNFTGMKKSISGNGFFNIIGCEFMDCLAPVIELERGRINSCVLSYISGNESVIHLKGNVICRDCYITSNGSTSNGIYITNESIVCDNMLSYLNNAIVCVGANNVIKGNVISNSKTEYLIGDTSLNKIYNRFGDPII